MTRIVRIFADLQVLEKDLAGILTNLSFANKF